MRLLVNGFHYRTSGSATPFDAFSREFESVESFVGKKVEVGCRNYAVRIDEASEGVVTLTFFFEEGEIEKNNIMSRRFLNLQILKFLIQFRLNIWLKSLRRLHLKLSKSLWDMVF